MDKSLQNNSAEVSNTEISGSEMSSADADKVFYRVPLSFVRRGGRITSSQEAAWDNYSADYLVDVERDVLDTSVASGAMRSVDDIFGNQNRLVVEIGTGMGEAIVYAAANNPSENFLGVEVYRAGLAKTMMGAADLALRNLRLVEANAPEVLTKLLPRGSVSEIRVFFPDPWHKAKHNKRRLISESFTGLVADSLVPGGLVRLATDWQEYADQMRDVFDSNPAFERNFVGDWDERFSGRPLTSFEQKGLKKDRIIRDLSYVKK